MKMLQGLWFEMMVTSTTTIASFLIIATCLILKFYNKLVTNPMKLRSLLLRQGIPGPPTHLLIGNVFEMISLQSKARRETEGSMAQHLISHDNEAALFSYTKKWRTEYGNMFTFALGTTQVLYVSDPDLVKAMATCTSLDFGKTSNQHRIYSPILGMGIVSADGDFWVRQRKLIAPEFFPTKVKGLVKLVNDSAESLIQTWKKVIDANGGESAEIEISEYLGSFTGDVISKFCFGSNYTKGEAIFRKLRALQLVLTKNIIPTYLIPGIRKLPTKSNREVWGLEKDIRDLILQVVDERKKEAALNDQKDLLQLLLDEAESDESRNEKERQLFILDNCKTFYLAGDESTAATATWCMMLLAVDQEWQARVRAEVMTISEGRTPTIDMLQKMKLLTMAIQETLRLYPAAPIVAREALKDLKIGGFDIPQSVNVWIMTLALHTDPDAWGTDSYSFNPSRFANGVAKACKYPQFYIPFGIGPRVCLGQNLAMLELKIIISRMITNFSFSLSEKYVHCPSWNIIVAPEKPVPLLFKHLQAATQ